MYCSKCGEKTQEGAAFCANCGNVLKEKDEVVAVNNPVVPTKPQGSGMATASMVLGILGIISSIITLFIALGYSAYMSYEYDFYDSLYYSSTIDTANAIAAVMIVFLPAVLSIIGFSLALASRGKIKNGANTAGLVLSIITIIICVLEVVMIVG